MGIDITKIETDKLNEISDSIVILPHNYLSDEKYEYHSTTLSFYKYSKDMLDIRYLSEPEFLIEQRSGEWFAPVLFITSMAISNNPELISIMCSVIANYVTDFFKGQKKPSIRLKVIHKETKSSKLTEISYEGDLEGLDKLKKSILKITSKNEEDE